MDFTSGGDLLNLLNRNLNLSLEDEKIYLVEIEIALEFIYSKSFVHKDVKLEIA
jgi:serine/threonine protein kinase